MASYSEGDERKGKGNVASSGAGTAAAEDGTQADQAIGQLPGIVNDLPEVAPHEWIYIMS